LVTRSPETIIASSIAASARMPALPQELRAPNREAEAKEIAIAICGSGQIRIAWCTLPPALAVNAICAQAIAIASRAKRIARSASPRASGVKSSASRKA